MPAPRSAPRDAHRRPRRARSRSATPSSAAQRAQHARPRRSTSRATPPRSQAQHAQQRMLAAPARHFQRLRREHQETAGEQRHQREHVQVDAVGARQVGAGLLHRVQRRHVRAGRQQRGDLRAHRLAVGARREAQVDAVQLAQPPEAPLRGGDVGERRDAAQAGADHAGDDRVRPLADRRLFSGFSFRELQSAQRQKNHIRLQQLQPLRRIVGEQRRLDQRRAQRIDADQADGLRRCRRSPASASSTGLATATPGRRASCA